MFLGWVENLGLLNPSPESNIIGLFSYNVKKSIVSEVVDHLLDTETSHKILATPAHVSWVMEAVGQGFGLKLEDVKVIEKCIELYRRWLSGHPDSLPPGLLASDQHFYRTILMHFTLLFEPRPNASESNLVVQVKLCLDVLDNIIRLSVHQLRNNLSTETWESWIKLLLGITDSIFVNNRQSLNISGHQFLEKSLGPTAFRVLLEVWLLSQTRNTKLWDSLLSLIPNWIRVSTIQHWNSITYALTQRTFALLYGNNYGTQHILIDWIVTDESNKPLQPIRSILRLDPEFVFYAWHRILHCLPNPSGFLSPEVYSTFFSGIEKLVEFHISTADKIIKENQTEETVKLQKLLENGDHSNNNDESKQLKKPPTSNVILSIFGRWIFESLMVDKPGFEEGTSTACRVLCKLFCRSEEYLTLYLANFYSAASKVLTKKITDKVTMTALLGMKQLFSRELKGSYVLIPYFFYSLSQVWREGSPSPNIRSACIDITSNLICISDHFQETKIISNLEQQIVYSSSRSQTLPDLDVYSSIKKHIRTLFYIAIAKEDNPKNLIKILWNIVVFLHDISDDDLKEGNEEYLVFSGAMITEILRNCHDHLWTNEVILVAYKAISSLTSLYQYLGKGQIGIAKSIITKLSEHIISCAFSLDSREENDKIIQRALISLTDWFLIDPNFPTILDKETINLMIYAIVTALGETARNGTKYTPSNYVKETAEYALNHILTSSNFPNTIGPHNVSTELLEIDILEEISKDMNESSQYMRVFVLDGHIILTLIDFPDHSIKKGFVYAFIRDGQGRHLWKGKMLLYENVNALNPVPQKSNNEPVKSPIHPDRYNMKEENEPQYQQLLQFLGNVWKDRYYTGGLISNTKTFVNNEKQYLENSSFGLDEDIRLKVEERHDPYSSECKFQYSRILLSHIGLLHPDTYHRIKILEEGIALTEQISQLDQLPERETISVGVILIENKVVKPFDYLASESQGPSDYQDFLSSLGWVVDLWTHTGFRGGLVHETSGAYAPYYANYSTEVIFEVANWIPQSNFASVEEAINEKKTIFNKNHVLIIWNTTNDYEPPSGSLKEMCYIIINPLKNGLYKIRVLNKDGVSILNSGPIIDNMVISKRVLGVMVRQTAIFVHRLFSQDSGPVGPMRRRKQKISTISKEFSRPQPFDDFLTALFSRKTLNDSVKQPQQQSQQQSQQPPTPITPPNVVAQQQQES